MTNVFSDPEKLNGLSVRIDGDDFSAVICSSTQDNEKIIFNLIGGKLIIDKPNPKK